MASKRIAGVEPDAKITTNENGGKQSDTPYGFPSDNAVRDE